MERINPAQFSKMALVGLIAILASFLFLLKNLVLENGLNRYSNYSSVIPGGAGFCEVPAYSTKSESPESERVFFVSCTGFF